MRSRESCRRLRSWLNSSCIWPATSSTPCTRRGALGVGTDPVLSREFVSARPHLDEYRRLRAPVAQYQARAVAQPHPHRVSLHCRVEPPGRSAIRTRHSTASMRGCVWLMSWRTPSPWRLPCMDWRSSVHDPPGGPGCSRADRGPHGARHRAGLARPGSPSQRCGAAGHWPCRDKLRREGIGKVRQVLSLPDSRSARSRLYNCPDWRRRWPRFIGPADMVKG